MRTAAHSLTQPRGMRVVPAPLRLAATCLAAVLLLAVEAVAEVGVVTSDPRSLPPARRAAVEAVEAALEDYGLPYRRVDEANLSERTLRGLELIVLPLSRVPQAEVLRAFAARGGRWVAYQATGDPVATTIMGLQVAAPLDGPSPTGIVPDPRPGTPPKVFLASGSPVILPLRATDPSFEAGRWDRTGGEVSALVRGPHGYFANFPPSAASGQGPLLIAMLADLEPPLWEMLLRHASRRASEAVDATALRWTHARQQPGWSEEQRGAIERAIRVRRAQLPDPGVGPLEINSNRQIASDRVNAARRLAVEATQLCYRMAVSRKGELRALQIAPDPKPDWEAVMRRARDAGLNAVFVDGSGELKPAIDTAHKYGLAFHLVLDVNRAVGEQQPGFHQLPPDRFVRDAEGRQGTFLNLGDPRNQELRLQIPLELVRLHDIDGIHFADLRYPDRPDAEWDFSTVSRREFEKASGKPVQKWPDEVVSGARKREYDDWQREQLNKLMQRCYQEIKKVKPYVQVSVAVGPRPRQSRAEAKQDWPLWVERGWVDFIVPFAATPDSEMLAALVDGQVSAARGKARVVAALSSAAIEEPLDLVRQVELVREQGSDGFVLLPTSLAELDPQLIALRAGATSEGTWPGNVAPEVEWSLAPTVERKDAPLAFLLGDRIPLEAKLSNASPTRVAVRSGEAELRLEDLQGRLLLPLGTMNSFNIRRVRFEAPAGKFRPVLRGSLSYVDGSARPFVVRGPVCEGLPNEELAALRAREAPPVVVGDGRRVGVYAGSNESAALLSTLTGSAGIRAFPLHRLKADHLSVAQALVLAELEDESDLNVPAEQALREWVSAGGTLVLLGEAVGARSHPRLFPEVGLAAGWAESRPLELIVPVGEQKAGSTFEASAGNYWRLRPGDAGQVIAREAGVGGAPVLISGRVGKGRVFLYGVAPGYGSRDAGVTETTLLRLLVRSPTGQ